MNWLVISILPPMIWALTNHVDKYFLNKYFKNVDGGAFIVVTSIISLLILPFILIFSPMKGGMDLSSILILIGIGAFSLIGGGLTYVYALQRANPSVVIPLFQLTPVFNYFLGLFFLKEHLSVLQIVGSLLIIGGAIALTAEQEGKKFKVQKMVLITMIACCLIHSVISLIFKLNVSVGSVWNGNFWFYFGIAIAGIVILIFHKGWRNQLVDIFKEDRAKTAGLLVFSEGISIGANFIFNYALLLMPIALISVVSNGLQPFFVLLFGIILTLIFPKLAHETLSKKHLVPKVCAIVVIFLGTIFLNR